MTRQPFSRLALAATLFAALPYSTVDAVTATPVPQAAQTLHLNNLKSKGSAEIDRRVSNLSASLAKLESSTKLSSSDKAVLSAQLTTEVAGLSALKTKLAAETTLAAARVEVASIVSDYRVYVLMLPKTRLVTSVDRISAAEDQLKQLAAKLQVKISAAQAAGKDVAGAQTTLADLTAKTTDATNKTGGLVASLLAIQPTDYNTNHAALTTYRSTLETAHNDLVAARADGSAIVQALSALK